jgi:hypothetical protein
VGDDSTGITVICILVNLKQVMKAATIHELKQELDNTSPVKVQELCLRLARFKKENKELLTYLLFEAHDTAAYIESVKNEIDAQFEGVNKNTMYFAKKTLRKIVRIAAKYIRYSGMATVEIEVLIHFCKGMKALDIPIQQTPALLNIYQSQVKKINKAMATLHEDIQYDYRREIDSL